MEIPRLNPDCLTSFSQVEPATVGRINDLLNELVGLCRRDLDNDGVPSDRQTFQRIAECRYEGQGFELRSIIADGDVTTGNVAKIIAGFHDQHRLDYGYAFDQGEVELITIRVIGTDKVTPLKLARLEQANGGGIDTAYLYERKTTFDSGETLDTPRYDRTLLRAGHAVPGPAVVTQHNSTVLVPPGYRATVTEFGNLIIAQTA